MQHRISKFYASLYRFAPEFGRAQALPGPTVATPLMGMWSMSVCVKANGTIPTEGLPDSRYVSSLTLLAKKGQKLHESKNGYPRMVKLQASIYTPHMYKNYKHQYAFYNVLLKFFKY